MISCLIRSIWNEYIAMNTAVQFGAGNIGRGFLAQLFHESGLEVVFVDVQPAIVEALNQRHSYPIHIVGEGAADVIIDRVRCIDGRDSKAVRGEVARCAVAGTAVGAAVLPQVAPALARGLVLRYQQGFGPLNVLVCENLHDAARQLRNAVTAQLGTDEIRNAVLERTGFVQAVVSRMVPLQTSPNDDPLGIRVEAYKRLPVDLGAIVGRLPRLVGVEPVSNFVAHVERKLYTHNCAHATLGYLGYEAGQEFAWQALEDSRIRSLLDSVMAETGEALIRKHGFDRQEHTALVADLMVRFANRELGDTCFRLARDPVRKLAPDDRLVGAARLCESQDVQPVALADVIAAALRFDAPDDPSAVELQRRIRDDGIERVMAEVCGIRSDDPLCLQILDSMHCA